MTLPDDFVFTQNNLQDFVDCPRRFQLKYLLKTAWPAPISEPIEENDRLIQLGSQFHQMVHQYYLGIPEEKITRWVKDEDLQSWWSAFFSNPPTDIPAARQPEIELSMPFEKYRLAAKIDLLAVEKGKRAVILDWKTTHKPPKPAFVSNRIQSLVYPFIAMSTGSALNDYKSFDPSQVTMIYWYPAYPDNPVILTFDSAWLEKTRAVLQKLVNEITSLKLDIFPLTVDTKKCQFCRYRSLCERGTTAGFLDEEDDTDQEDEDSPDINFDEIEGIAF
jgi:hypothetical protein